MSSTTSPTFPTPLRLLAQAVAEAFELATGLEHVDPLVAPCGNPQMGDYQSNAAMGVAGRLKKERGEKVNPRQLATDVAAKLEVGDLLAAAPDVAGPGFVNFRLSPDWVARQASAALVDDRIGVPVVAQPQTVVIEYSSPNIAKQLHVGHFRATILGDSVARASTFAGHSVIRQNHVGDWGTQFGMLIARLREAGGLQTADIGDLESFYKQAKQRFDEDDDFKQIARETVVALQRGDEEVVEAWQRFIDETRRHYEPLYGRLGVLLERGDERGESFYNDKLPGVVGDLLDAGVAVESEGAVVSFAGGFESPLMIRKSDGGYGYGTTDLAACKFRASELARRSQRLPRRRPSDSAFSPGLCHLRRGGGEGRLARHVRVRPRGIRCGARRRRQAVQDACRQDDSAEPTCSTRPSSGR